MPLSTIFSRIVSLYVREEFVEDLLLGSDLLLQLEKGLGLEVAEGKILQFAANQAHAEPVGNRRVNVERLARDALLPFGAQKFERAHVVQAIGELDHDDAYVVHHGQQHLAHVLGLAVFRRE